MADASPSPQQILLVTGLSGAGKSTVLQVLEDLGWEAIDNFPIRLLDGLMGTQSNAAPLAIGFDSRTRGFAPADVIALCHSLRGHAGVNLATLFIDCADSELERRYNETRRPHPMARGRPAIDGIGAERDLLAPLRDWADIVIDTTAFSINQLQQVVRDRFAEGSERTLTVTITSFGFARGMPPLADLLFDMRFLNNPHWVEDLRGQSGLDPAVAAHIAADPAFQPAFARIADLLREVMPRYAAQGRSYLNIAFGCTGGRHRSVFSAECAARVLREAGFSPTVIHRNLDDLPVQLRDRDR